MAATTRQHNDSNVICFSADHTTVTDAASMLRVWLDARFEGGRHARRVEKILAIENAD
jgi:ribose 5-phosphate isomerase B